VWSTVHGYLLRRIHDRENCTVCTNKTRRHFRYHLALVIHSRNPVDHRGRCLRGAQRLMQDTITVRLPTNDHAGGLDNLGERGG
jgi:hypothetical protein